MKTNPLEEHNFALFVRLNPVEMVMRCFRCGGKVFLGVDITSAQLNIAIYDHYKNDCKLPKPPTFGQFKNLNEGRAA